MDPGGAAAFIKRAGGMKAIGQLRCPRVVNGRGLLIASSLSYRRLAWHPDLVHYVSFITYLYAMHPESLALRLLPS